MQEQASEFAAFVGIDWADRKHDVCMQVPSAAAPEACVLEHRPTVIDAWARGLRERFGGRPIAVCVELAQGPIVSALLEYDFFVIFPVNPSFARFRPASLVSTSRSPSVASACQTSGSSPASPAQVIQTTRPRERRDRAQQRDI